MKSNDKFVSLLEEKIAAIKKDREWSGKYMLFEIMMAEERKAGREEGLETGRLHQLVEQCCRKLAKGQSAETIADALESDPEEIARIVEAAGHYAPDYDAEKICEELLEMKQKSET